MKLFDVAPKEELMITKITRPLSFWLLIISFLILIFLNSFGIIHTDKYYLDIFKTLLIIMTGFYFTARSAEKIATMKYQSQANQVTQINTLGSSQDTSETQEEPSSNILKKINPDKL